MICESKKSRVRQAVRLILPKEHGSWSLALEPLALGLLVAPSAAGGALAVAALSGFFLRRPLKQVFNGKSDSRRPLALGCVAGLSALAFAGLSLAVKFDGVMRLWPLLPAALAGMAFLWFDLRNETREGAVEVAGAIAFGILPAAFGALAGWGAMASIALAAVMLARSVPTVLFVRTYLRFNKGRTATGAPALIAAGAGLFLTAWLVFTRLAPWPAAVFALAMTARTTWLVGWRPRLAAKTLGIAEATFGTVMILALAIAWKNF
ncbi:MAG: YwiC-like family protein [Verrucomicrobiia bacterium]